MDIRVSGHQVETGAALQDHARDRMEGMVEKYFNRAISSHVTFGKAGAGAFACDIVLHVMQGLILKGHAEAHDHTSLRQGCRQDRETASPLQAPVERSPRTGDHAARQEEAAYTIFASPEPAEEEPETEEAGDAPVVVAETKVDIPEGRLPMP